MKEVAKTHAKYSASGAERFLNCAASIKMSEGFPDTESAASIEGTTAHACLEFMLKNGNTEAVRKNLRRTYNSEMIEHAEWAFEEITKDVKKGFVLLSEVELDLKWLDKEAGGTVDAAVVNLFGDLIVYDYKFGRHPVDPDANTQGIMYALAIAHKYDFNFENVRIVILQPRADHKDGPRREWSIRCDKLKNWVRVFVEGIARTKVKNPKFVTGKWCHFCKGRVVCPEISKKALAQTGADFDDLTVTTLPAIVDKKVPRLGEYLDAAEKLETWIEAVKDYAYNFVANGGKLEGWKLVEKKGKRQWNDLNQVAKLALKKFGRDKAFSIDLLTPAQLEKATKDKDFVAKHATHVSSGTTLAPESDPRPSVTRGELDFDVIEIEGETLDVNRPKEKTKSIGRSNSNSTKTDRRRRAIRGSGFPNKKRR